MVAKNIPEMRSVEKKACVGGSWYLGLERSWLFFCLSLTLSVPWELILCGLNHLDAQEEVSSLLILNHISRSVCDLPQLQLFSWAPPTCPRQAFSFPFPFRPKDYHVLPLLKISGCRQVSYMLPFPASTFVQSPFFKVI